MHTTRSFVSRIRGHTSSNSKTFPAVFTSFLHPAHHLISSQPYDTLRTPAKEGVQMASIAPSPNSPHPMPYRDEHLTLDFAGQHATLDAESIVLTRKEYELLALLVQHAGEIIPRGALLLQVW